MPLDRRCKIQVERSGQRPDAGRAGEEAQGRRSALENVAIEQSGAGFAAPGASTRTSFKIPASGRAIPSWLQPS